MTPVFPDSPTVIRATEVALGNSQNTESSGDPTRDFSDRLLRSFLGLCENPRTRQGMLKMVRGSVGSARAGQAFYRVLNRTVVNPAAKASGMHASVLKYELVSAQLVGLAMMRYVLQIEPVASLPVDDVVEHFAPAIRATLKG